MQTLKSTFISFTFFFFAFSSSCFAVGTTYQGIFQPSATTGENPLQNTLFNRDTYDGIGSAVWITGAYDVDGNYIVPVGST